MCTMTMTMPRRSKTHHDERPARPARPPRGRCESLTPAQRRKVRHVRAAIRAGEYENALKLEVTVERLLAKLTQHRARA